METVASPHEKAKLKKEIYTHQGEKLFYGIVLRIIIAFLIHDKLHQT